MQKDMETQKLINQFNSNLLSVAKPFFLFENFSRLPLRIKKKIFIKKNGQKRIHERIFKNGKMIKFHAYDLTKEIEEKMEEEKNRKIKFRRYQEFKT